ncbi:MAG: hypothetical protein HC767_05145, partial [Akkermansiaceae bacterium]|nr:hypothetical protein [Akkermansiaceae bacterium]
MNARVNAAQAGAARLYLPSLANYALLPMRFFTALTLYRLLLPWLFVVAFPGWVLKMLKRGGFGSKLGERAAIYHESLEYEPCGAVHIHAVSVGEVILAIKLIREWLVDQPGRKFVLATGTATGHAVARSANLPNIRVTYAPLDFRWMVRCYLNRFEPSQIVLIEGEVWPHLLLECEQREIPVRLVNARMSPRSARRFSRFAAWLRPIYSLLDAVAIQEKEDTEIWEQLGLSPEKIHFTGSLKYDPGSGQRPNPQAEFQEIIDSLGRQRPIILAASTFAGEEVLIAKAIKEAAPGAFTMVAPRHAERRAEVVAALAAAGFSPILRSAVRGDYQTDHSGKILVIDTTGELRDWTAHADVVIIGKTFLSTGGQNPCEAILARKPVIFGPHMENFQPLSNQLIAANAVISVGGKSELIQSIQAAL